MRPRKNHPFSYWNDRSKSSPKNLQQRQNSLSHIVHNCGIVCRFRCHSQTKETVIDHPGQSPWMLILADLSASLSLPDKPLNLFFYSLLV
jgi:hypothetical protein